MRTGVASFILLLLTVFGYAREETLLTTPVVQGGYAAPVFKMSKIGPSNSSSLMVGGQGGWILDHRLVLGAGIYGLMTKVDAPQSSLLENHYIVFNYGGILVSYVYKSHKLFHLEGFTIVGGGSAQYRDENYSAISGESDWCTVFEPGLNVIMNILDNFRIGVGLSYRQVNKIGKLRGLSNKDFTGLNTQVILKLGSF